MTTPSVPTKGTKAIVAAVGVTLTALTTWLAAVAVAVGDDAIDFEEIGALVLATLTLASTVYGVWRVPNEPKPNPYA